jgi:hypothetical protein
VSGDLSGLYRINVTRLLRVQRIPKIDRLLKVEPELGLSPCELGEPQDRVRSDRTLSIDDLVHPGLRDTQTLRSGPLSHPDRDKEVFEEDLAGLRGASVLWKAHVLLLVILRPCLGPPKTDSVLVIDPDRVLLSSISLQLLEPQARQRQRDQRDRSVQLIERPASPHV